ncbi:MAG: pyrroline-5-carboxylate reductase family protein [Ruminococcus sp.]
MDTIGFIGVGNMGSAILKGIAGSSLKQETSLFAYNPTEAKVDALANCGVQKCGAQPKWWKRAGTCSWRLPQKFEEYCAGSQMQ